MSSLDPSKFVLLDVEVVVDVLKCFAETVLLKLVLQKSTRVIGYVPPFPPESNSQPCSNTEFLSCDTPLETIVALIPPMNFKFSGYLTGRLTAKMRGEIIRQ